MKKLVTFAAVALAACALFVSCASTGGAKASGAASTHPRTYILDPADGGASATLAYNSYGPNYQVTIDMWNYYKKDKPLAGDTINVKAKITANNDIPNVVYYIADNSPAANYWTVISDDNYILDMKAGEAYDIDVSIVLTGPAKGSCNLVFAYDGVDHGQADAPKIGKESTFTFEKVADTTDTANEVPDTPHVTTRDVAIEKYAAFFEVATNHPWIDGKQDMSVISNYQGMCDISNLYGEDLPKAGDTLNVTWRAKSNCDIAKLNIRAIDNSAAAGWWKEIDENAGAGVVLVEDIKADEPFECSMTITYGADAIGAVALCIWYDIGEADGPAIITLVRD